MSEYCLSYYFSFSRFFNIMSLSNVNKLCLFDKELFSNVVDVICSTLTAKRASEVARTLVSLSLSEEEENILSNKLQVNNAEVKQLVQCIAGLILKIGVFGIGCLIPCGLTSDATEILTDFYSRHKVSLAPLVDAVSKLQCQEVFGISRALSVDTCSSTSSRLCEPQCTLQLDVRQPTADCQLITSESVEHLIMQFDRKQLYEFYCQLESVQECLDSFT